MRLCGKIKGKEIKNRKKCHKFHPFRSCIVQKAGNTVLLPERMGNMRKKRIMALLLGVMLTAASICGCGSAGNAGREEDGSRRNWEGAVPETDEGGSDRGSLESEPSDSGGASSKGESGRNADAASMETGLPGAAATEAAADSAAEAYQAGMYDIAVCPGEEIDIPEWNTEEYDGATEIGYKSVADAPLSTFSADVDTASYSNLRRMIMDGCSLEDIPQGAVRIEEMLNYFSYDYDTPEGKEPFGVTTVLGDCPWNGDAKLLQIGLKTEEIDFGEAPPSNLVFLLDVSGSMYSADKLPLLQKSFGLLAEGLTEKDRVSIVTYAGMDQVLLEGADGSRKAEITAAVDSLEASGSTNGSAGIETAYKLAEKYFIEGGNNRVILATDGDLNVGLTSESELEELISEKKETGVFLSVLGFGTGNLKDNKLEALADRGNGNYAYIDSLSEARKVLVEEMGATLFTVAKDVKLQVEFNPAYVKGYRLLGYENRMLQTEDFDDDAKDAGEIGAGHTVTALYEIIPVDSPQEVPETELKYQDRQEDPGVKNGEWLNLRIRYKEPESDASKLCTYPVTEAQAVYLGRPPKDFYFAAAVAEFGLLVRDSAYKGKASFANVKELLKKADTGEDPYREEFVFLVKTLERNSIPK